VLVNAESLERELLDNKGVGPAMRLHREGSGFEEAPVESSGKESGFTFVKSPVWMDGTALPWT
jgi:hypothetical protein